jgi:hypothetical protein
MSTAATPSPENRPDLPEHSPPPETTSGLESDLVPIPPPATQTRTPVPEWLLKEIDDFCCDSKKRYKFNSNWDNTLNGAGILLSVAIIASGVYKWSEGAAMLGGLVAAIVTTQRAFPFNQRASFYRILIGQTQNLSMAANAGMMSLEEVIPIMKTLRLDFAQQLPRGSNFKSEGPGEPSA